ncbi:hypothetical protein [Neobacillus niacini]|uniref:hypothetical protein n=1 Tax=Neobacillus niacini TaxID=86668 RepID=UPI0005EDC21D|nr:hypothetical protein [Neobacillus niacini]
MEKNFAVEVWGNPGNLGVSTELFYTEKEAIKHFKDIRKKLDSTKFTFSKESIIDKENNDNAIYITNLKYDL